MLLPEQIIRQKYPVVLEAKLVRSTSLYDVWSEVWDDELYPRGDTKRRMVIEIARNKDGGYIGTPDNARFLCDHLGISPELRTQDSNVCSIGYSEKSRRWYGWSHRAIHGFRPGDSVVEGEIVSESIAPGTSADGEAGARRFAEAFAAAVS